MYFILSKVLLFLLFPLLWVFALVIAGLVTKNKKRKKRLFISSVVLLFLLSNSFLFNEFATLWGYQPYSGNEKYSCAIVLGGFSSADKNGNGYFNESADRFIQGVRLLETGRVKRILITGGNGNLIAGNYREGTWTKEQLKDLNIPDSSILIESNSRNTIENADFSKRILLANHVQPPYLLVTSDFHMRRSMMIFKKHGLDVVAYPCNYMAGHGDISIASFLIPDANALDGWSIYLKEIVGYVVDYWK
ncbi:Uncharacterized SAM-binding protein YcdF, DUF218 family [Mucilaginibacter mallensis]|uniref:Uncharacterized SAM-binding protein YcdF, DUF218 family n=1 Tax=Mucilaginibacter mallensis TaxID=652787 RepID=A0A1H2BNQ9_MUCMA|nr:YdcF family protein [Mucilaginibacter mallensis]SDT59692.1 Uncharacterized SAM-binding protein YcdF, DUF218 family [Mucilaginibacter mallensis]